MINIDRENSTPLYMQIKTQLKDMILTGKLSPGYKLPPERKLADILNVNRSTILNAYRELKADNLAISTVGQGTIVNPALGSVANINNSNITPIQLPWKHLYSKMMSLSSDTITQDILELANRKDVISFAAGIAIPELNPLEELKKINEELISQFKHVPFQHTSTQGYYPLRDSIRNLMQKKGIIISNDEIMILSGSQQGLDFSARAFINQGDIVFTEEPSYFCARQIFEAFGANVIGIPMDDDGMSMESLSYMLSRFKPKFIYTIPNFHNPTGITMSLEKRKKLLALSYKHQTPILEDDAYGELRYEGEQIPSLKALDQNNYVVYLSTFSKVLFMGLRIGWVAAPKQVIQQFKVLKQISDVHTNSFSQWCLDRLIRENNYSNHIQTVLKENKRRRDIMLNSLNRFKPQNLEISWIIPEGGLYIWCSLPDEIDQKELMKNAEEKRIAFVPAKVFYSEDCDDNCIRLNFTFPSPNQIEKGIQLLMEAITDSYKEKQNEANSYTEIKPIV